MRKLKGGSRSLQVKIPSEEETDSRLLLCPSIVLTLGNNSCAGSVSFTLAQ